MIGPAVHLLVSVRNGPEADAALAGGANVIDVKEPSHGSLGMAQPQVIDSVLKQVNARAPVSAAMGEIGDERKSIPTEGLAYIKIGLARAPQDWQSQLQQRFQAAGQAKPVVVAYADHRDAGAPPVHEVLAWGRQHAAAGLLVDTAGKACRHLFDYLDPQQVCDLIVAAHNANMFIALAGSLNGNAFEQAVKLRPDIVAVRGAACVGGDRNLPIDQSRVASLARLIAAHSEPVGRCAG